MPGELTVQLLILPQPPLTRCRRGPNNDCFNTPPCVVHRLHRDQDAGHPPRRPILLDGCGVKPEMPEGG
eukprot:11181368-Lingulodinium_polyedra.AAC.1